MIVILHRVNNHTSSTIRVLLFASLAITTVPWTASGQNLPTLTPRDHGRFESLGPSILSPDGRWIAYGIGRANDTTELRLRPIAHDSTRVFPWGTAARFSADSRWLAWSSSGSPDDRASIQTTGQSAQLRAGLLDLSNGQERTFHGVRIQRFDATGRFIALHGYEAQHAKGRGADLRILDLATGGDLSFGSVAQFVWHDSLPLLALALSTGTHIGNGVQVYDARSGRIIALDAADATYPHLAWRKDAPDLVVLRTSRDTTRSAQRVQLIAWRAIGRRDQLRIELDSATIERLDSLAVSDQYAPQWSRDGSRIALGLRFADEVHPAGDSSFRRNVETPSVEVWHSSDVKIIPQQQAEARTPRTLLGLWHLARRSFVRLSSSLDEEIELLDGWQFAWERTDARYPFGAKFGRPYHDVWIVNAESGKRELALDSVRHTYASGAGRYLLSFDGSDYWTFEVATGVKRNITRRLGAVFADTTSDLPSDMSAPYGVGGWLDDDRAVLLYDEHDIWRVAPDGSGAKRLTNGASEHVVHRAVRTDQRSTTFSTSTPIYLSLHGDVDQKRGYARVTPSGDVERLLFRDKRVTGLTRATASEIYAYRIEARDDPPDYFVGDETLARAAQVTATNRFMNGYAWPRTELVIFQNERGRELRGVLLYPANHDSSRRYPMIVFAYELMSSQAHVFQPPDERIPYNFTSWTQQGYFVLLPDVMFRARDPGVSLLETLRPAVDSIVRRGLVDRARVGFAGHSWGGYLATFVATHSGIFAASVAGAPLTDMVSFMGQIHRSDGTPEVDHWETAQPRMQVPFWEDPAAYQRNSPLHNVHDMKTPLLMAFGKNDGIIDWGEGIQFYNFARRAGKQMVLLVYEGEDHFLRRRPNQVDYHRRILEWFGHYLKGQPAPRWIEHGITLGDLEAETQRLARP